MDQADSTTLLAHLQDIPDPRHKRGQSYEWRYLLALIIAAIASGHKNVAAIAQWVHEHGQELLANLHPAKGRLPSYATLRRAVIAIDIDHLEHQVATHNQALDQDDTSFGCLTGADGTVWRGQSVDGKDVRGASAHGSTVHLVGMARHESGYVLQQVKVKDKSNEITAVPLLLQGHAVAGTVTTMDALLTQQSIAEQILAHGGDYLMVVKKNQGNLWSAIDQLFRKPPTLVGDNDLLRIQQTSKAHGRYETRTLESSVLLNDYVKWPGVGQVLRRTYHSVSTRTGEVRHEVTYGLTSLSRGQALPEHVEWFWRQHWTIENRDHYVRDDTMGEDRGQIHKGNAAQALAALRNAVIARIRHDGWTNVAAALRHYGAFPQRALHLVGALPT
jgi:predicted transposase YbfD/YdcC